MEEEFEEQRISENHHIHFTPRFDKVEENYPYFNKPFGVLHFLENSIGLDPTTGHLLDENVMIAVFDPDHIFLSPLKNDFPSPLISPHVQQAHEKDGGMFPRTCTHGHPIAQQYSLGALWRDFDLGLITLDPHSPSKNVSLSDALAYYPVGSPYLATGRDMLTIARDWSKFLRPVRAQYPHL